MNLPNLATLITTVESSIEAVTFDMDNFLHPCGSPACIIGHAAALENGGPLSWPHLTMLKKAARYLGITLPEAKEIGVGWIGDADNEVYHVSSERAIEYLKATQEAERVIPWAEFLGEYRP
jgi:hypothetical protein